VNFRRFINRQAGRGATRKTLEAEEKQEEEEEEEEDEDEKEREGKEEPKVVNGGRERKQDGRASEGQRPASETRLEVARPCRRETKPDGTPSSAGEHSGRSALGVCLDERTTKRERREKGNGKATNRSYREWIA